MMWALLMSLRGRGKYRKMREGGREERLKRQRYKEGRSGAIDGEREREREGGRWNCCVIGYLPPHGFNPLIATNAITMCCVQSCLLSLSLSPSL